MVLSREDLEMISQYRYKPGSYTKLDDFLTPFWNWAVTLLPLWMAPNLVTFIGLVGATLAAALVTSYSPRLDEEIPAWRCLVFGVAIFWYQTLDAIDGKQARRTSSSSPLGQLFDHGCDAVVKVVSCVAMCAVVGVGGTSNTMIIFAIVEGVFYMAQWEEYHTGTLNWSNGYIGVTESQLAQVALFFASAYFGLGIRDAVVPRTSELTFVQALIWGIIPLAAAIVVSNIRKVWNSRPEDLPEDERGRKDIGFEKGVLQLLAMSVAMGLGFALSVGPAARVFEQHAALQLCLLGTVTTHLTSRMIVHHMAKSALLLEDLTCSSLWVLALVALNVHWPTLRLGEVSPWDPEWALFAGFGLALACYLRYVISVISEICRHLGIECFRIKRKAQD